LCLFPIDQHGDGLPVSTNIKVTSSAGGHSAKRANLIKGGEKQIKTYERLSIIDANLIEGE